MIKKMLSKIYNFLVNGNRDVIFFYTLSKFRHQKIYRHCCFLLWFYLALLVIKFRIFGRDPKKSLPVEEDRFYLGFDKQRILSKIKKAEVISFDVFDTLLLRKVTDPKEVFEIVGNKLGVVNYRAKRVFAEKIARQRCANGEVSLLQICKAVEELYGIDADLAYTEELEAEREVCVANQLFLEIMHDDAIKGKHIIAVSDMYLPSEFIRELLNRCGFYTIDEIYVSNARGCSKAEGGLWCILRDMFAKSKVVHFGDNCYSDMKMCGKAGINYFGVPNIHWIYQYYRECGVESTVMSLYSAQVNRRNVVPIDRSQYYRHGYVYGGILTYGFCQWLNQLAHDKGYDLLLFTARDSKVFYNVFSQFFGDIRCEYLYISRFAALKLSYEKNFELYFDIMFRSKFRNGHNLTVGQVLRQADLGKLTEKLRQFGLQEEDKLNSRTLNILFDFLLSNRVAVAEAYREDKNAFSLYISSVLQSAKRVCVIDLGWRGTVYSLLSDYFSEHNKTTELYGAMVGGVNSEISKDLIESERLHCYAFSHRHNVNYMADMKKIILLEVLYSSSTPTVTGYKLADGKVFPVFGETEEEKEYYFDEMHKGIYDFCEEFNGNMNLVPYIRGISGAEAFAPINQICENKRYNAKVLEKIKFSLEANFIPNNVGNHLRKYKTKH